MVIGEHSRPNDLDVNPLRAKKLTNIRAAGKDDNLLLTPPVRMTLERAIAYVADDELVEVTPRRSACASASSTPTSAARTPNAPRWRERTKVRRRKATQPHSAGDERASISVPEIFILLAHNPKGIERQP